MVYFGLLFFYRFQRPLILTFFDQHTDKDNFQLLFTWVNQFKYYSEAWIIWSEFWLNIYSWPGKVGRLSVMQILGKNDGYEDSNSTS